jgi:replicative DNA helicase
MNSLPDIQNTHYDFSSKTAEDIVIADLLSGSPHTRKIIEYLKPEDFVSGNNSKLFENLQACLENGNIEAYSLKLTEQGYLPTPTRSMPNIEAYSLKLTEQGYLPTPTRSMPIWTAAKVIVDNAQKRALWSFSVQMNQDLADPAKDASGLQNGARIALSDAVDSRTSDMPDDFGDSVESAEKAMEFSEPAMITGLRDLDRKVRVLSDSLIVVGARPSQGKSAFGISVIANNLLLGKMPALWSMEMNDETTIYRLVSIFSGVPFEFIVKGWEALNEDQSRKVRAAYDQLRNFKTHKHWLSCQGRASVNQLRDWLDLVRPDFGVVDYGQLMNATKKRSSRREELGDITGDLRELVTESGIPLFVLAQLNRNSDEDKQPKMKHIRESGTFEQDATDVILIDRPESGSNPEPVKRGYRDPNTGKDLELVSEEAGRLTGNAALLIDKQRNGACGYCPVKFSGPVMRFYDFPIVNPTY